MNPSQLSVFLRDKIFPYVQAPGQYLGGEINSVVKPNFHGGKFCMIFPDNRGIWANQRNKVTLASTAKI